MAWRSSEILEVGTFWEFVSFGSRTFGKKGTDCRQGSCTSDMTQPEQTLAQRKDGPKEKQKKRRDNNYKCDYKITVNRHSSQEWFIHNIRFNSLHNRKHRTEEAYPKTVKCTLLTSDVVYKKNKRLVYTFPDLFAKFFKVNLSNLKYSAWFVFQEFVFQA